MLLTSNSSMAKRANSMYLHIIRSLDWQSVSNPTILLPAVNSLLVTSLTAGLSYLKGFIRKKSILEFFNLLVVLCSLSNYFLFIYLCFYSFICMLSDLCRIMGLGFFGSVFASLIIPLWLFLFLPHNQSY